MSEDAEKDASEVLHSLLSIERLKGNIAIDGLCSRKKVTYENQFPDAKLEMNDNYSQIADDNNEDDRQNETVDVETPDLKDNIKEPRRSRQKKQKNSLIAMTTSKPSCDSSEEEDDTPEHTEAVLTRGCECRGNCYKNLEADSVYKHRLNIAELTKNEHDMYLMGVTMACMADSKITSRQKERQRQRATYVYQGRRVCLEAFLYLENCTLYHIKRIRNHILEHGVTPRVHGNMGKRPHNTFSLDMYKNVENYVKKYLQPHLQDFNKNQVIYGVTRADIYNSYKDHGRQPNEKLMGYSTFRHFMTKQFPQIKFQKSIDVNIGLKLTSKKRSSITKLKKNLQECAQKDGVMGAYEEEEVEYLEMPMNNTFSIDHFQSGANAGLELSPEMGSSMFIRKDVKKTHSEEAVICDNDEFEYMVVNKQLIKLEREKPTKKKASTFVKNRNKMNLQIQEDMDIYEENEDEYVEVPVKKSHVETVKSVHGAVTFEVSEMTSEITIDDIGNEVQTYIFAPVEENDKEIDLYTETINNKPIFKKRIV